MKSLEKDMFFLPNRLYVNNLDMYLSFNIAVIPIDMNVTTMTLNVPLYEQSIKLCTVKIFEIGSGWSVNLMKRGYKPKIRHEIAQIKVYSFQKELSIDLTQHENLWRFDSLNNHGVYLKVETEHKSLFKENEPPYLIVSTL